MMSRSSKAYLGMLILLCAIPVGAQQTGEIRGRIVDETGEALPGVTVTATSPSLQGVRTAISAGNGNFRLPILSVGTYSLTFELAGFEELTISGQDVRLGYSLDISIKLKPTAVKKEVTVTAPAPLIDKIRTDTSYRLNSDELTRVPVQSRTISEVVGLTPGVTGVRFDTSLGGSNFGPTPMTGAQAETGYPSFRGEGNAGNNWLIDGLSTRGGVAFDPGVQVNYDAWEEVQVISDGFSPEMGQGMGGFINIVTKSGGNDFHGELGGLIRSQHLRAQRQEQLSQASVPNTSLSQYFGNLGGPIFRDKLWFFFSDNYFGTLDQTTEQTIDWLTIPAGDRRVGTNNAFGKVTFTPWRNHTISLGGTLDKSLNQSGRIGMPEIYQEFSYTNSFYRLNYRGVLSQNTLLTAGWGQSRRKNSMRPQSGDYGPPSYYWMDVAQTTNNSENNWSAAEQKSDLAVGLTQYFNLKHWGSHELKGGFSYYHNKYEDTWPHTGQNVDPWPANGFDDGAKITWAAPGIALQFTELGPRGSRNSTEGIGIYVQDGFSAGRFSFMLGLRSDTQTVFNDRGEVAWSWNLGDFLQPRASAAFDLTGDGLNIIKFGYGRFAMPIAIWSLAGIINKTSPIAFRLYEWLGPQNPSDLQLINPANWGFIYEWSSVAAPEQVDPDLRPNKTDKFLLEYDRQLGANWALKFRGVYSRGAYLVDDIGVYDPEVPGSVRYIFTNFEFKRRDYRALEVELNGRIAGRFMLNASYTWSQARGTNSGNQWEGYGWGSSSYGDSYDWTFFGNQPVVPAGAPDKDLIDSLYHGLGGVGVGDEGWYGFLPYSVDHVAKVLGTYFAPYGLVVSSNIEFLSGYHWEKKGWSDMGFFCLFPEGRGGRTTPAHMYVDLAIEKDIRLGKRMSLGLGINAYNLLNSQQPVAFAKEDNELFGQVWARQLPRWVQLRFSLRF